MRMKIAYGHSWSVYICLVFLAIEILILFKEELSHEAIMWLGHIFIASFTGFIALLIVNKLGPWSMFDNILLNITLYEIAILLPITIGCFLKELYLRR